MKLLTLLLIAFAVTAQAAAVKDVAQTCPSSGRIQVSSTQTKASAVFIQAPTTNTGLIYVGGSDVTTSNAAAIQAFGSFTFPAQANVQPYDLSQIFIACTVNTDVIRVTYVQ